jgi:hypothetical protein
MKRIDIFNEKVSVFKKIFDPTPAGENKIIDLVVGDRFADRVNRMRRETDQERKTMLKKTLPAFTASGVFSGRNDSDLMRHSGVIAIDIDYKDNKHLNNYDKLKEIISSVPYVAYCGKSAGGEGYFLLIPIKEPEKHDEHFASLRRDFERCGLAIDPSCSNVGRLRFVSFDPEPYINRDAEIYPFILKDKKNHRGIPQVRPAKADPVKLEEVTAWARIAEEEGINSPFVYDEWFSMACAMAFEFGEGGRDAFHCFSRAFPDYDPEDCDRKFGEAKKAVRETGKHHPTFTRIRELFTKYGVTAIADFR